MYWDLISAEYLSGYKLKVKFQDGKEGVLDLSNKLRGEVFQGLLQESEFSKFYIHPELKLLTWPNGADLAPEFVYGLCRV